MLFKFVKTCAAFVIDFYVFIFNRRFYPSDLQVTKGTSQTVFQRFTAQIWPSPFLSVLIICTVNGN